MMNATYTQPCASSHRSDRLTRPHKAAPPVPDLVKRHFTAAAINVLMRLPSVVAQLDGVRRAETVRRGPWRRRAAADVEHAQHQSHERDPNQHDDEDGDHVATLALAVVAWEPSVRSSQSFRRLAEGRRWNGFTGSVGFGDI